MKEKLKKLFAYYAPYKPLFYSDMFFAVLGAGVTLIICLINNNGQQAKTRALMEYKIDELTKKVAKHNSVVERTFLLEEKLKVANHRIEDLERKVE